MKLNRHLLRNLILQEIKLISEGDHEKDYHSDHAKEISNKHGEDHHVADVTPKIKVTDGKSFASALTAGYLTQDPTLKSDILSIQLGNKTFNFGTKYDPKKNNFKATSSLELVSDDHGKHLVLSIDGVPDVIRSKIEDYHDGEHDDHGGEKEHGEDINLGLHTAIKAGDVTFTLGGHTGVMSILDKHPHYALEATASWNFDKKRLDKKKAMQKSIAADEKKRHDKEKHDKEEQEKDRYAREEGEKYLQRQKEKRQGGFNPKQVSKKYLKPPKRDFSKKVNENKILKQLERIKAKSIAIKLIKEQYKKDIRSPEDVEEALRMLTQMVLNNQTQIENILNIIRATDLGVKAIDSGKLGPIHSKLKECIKLNKTLLK